MKKLSFLLSLLAIILLISCATVREPIPVKKKIALSQDSINALELAEELASNARFKASAESEKSKVDQPLVSNIFVEMDIRAVIMDIATQTGVNIIPDNSVNGAVSMTLKDVPLEKALEMILYPGGYKYRYIADGKYYIVGRSLPENASFESLTITKTIKTNRGAGIVISQLSPFFQMFTKADGQNITITASPDVVNRIEKDVSSIDKSRRQIEITAQFMMVEWDKGTSLGAQWSDINLSASGIGNLISGGAQTFSSDLAGGLNIFLQTNGYNAKVKTMAEPRIVVEDGEVAELKVTEEHLFLILSGGGAAYNYFTTKDVEVGIKLKVKPSLTRDGKLRLDINPEVADIIGEREFKSNGGPTQKLPIIARRSTNTTLKVENGETVALGGLITKLEKTKKSGIPVLRGIPLLGYLFGNDNNQKKETELVIFITSKIIN